MVSVEDTTFEGAGYVLKQHIWNAARDTLEEWTGYRQAECSLYGIRVYKEGAMLAPHVDRLPLVASAIINVDQDVDELWPLEVIGHDGIARNVTMLPGDMVLYESHSVIHGRQFPLKGRFMANVFIHFEPVGPIGGQVEYTGDLPPYVIPGSLEEPHWRERHPDGHKYLNSKFTTGSTELHSFSAKADIANIQRVLDKHENLINVRDANGWTPLHEAVRKGDKTTVELLLDRGAEINARTGIESEGGSILWLAKNTHGPDHDIIQLLVTRGAKEYKPFEKEL
jgi:prolyl 4-hydroxylase